MWGEHISVCGIIFARSWHKGNLKGCLCNIVSQYTVWLYRWGMWKLSRKNRYLMMISVSELSELTISSFKTLDIIFPLCDIKFVGCFFSWNKNVFSLLNHFLQQEDQVSHVTLRQLFQLIIRRDGVFPLF